MSSQKLSQHYYDALFAMFRNAEIFLPLAMIVCGLLARSGFADSRYYDNDATFALITSANSFVMLLFVLYGRKRDIPPALRLAFAFCFHLFALLFIVFVAGFINSFSAVWIVLLVGTDMRFGLPGYVASLLALVATAITFVVLHPSITTGEQLGIAQIVLVVAIVGFVIARIRSITDHERSDVNIARLRESYQRERLLALINSMGDAVLATDEHGIIKVYNSSLLSLLDTNTNLVGKRIDNVLHLIDASNKPLKIIDEAKRQRSVFSRTDLSRLFSGGETIRLYINVAPIQPGYRSHAERGYIFVLRDITKEKTLEEQRDEFISVVSHELRTPVAIAEGSISNIMLLQQRGASPEMLQTTAQAAHDHIMYLAKLVNDLGTLSRAERGLGADIEIFDPLTVLQQLFHDNTSQAQNKKLALNIDTPAILPRLKSSRLYLEEILQNLITNAIKYTKEGSVTIKARVTNEGLVIGVSDTGIGISKADQKHMFEKFYRSEDYRTRESNGTGLGLYLCKKLAEKIGFTLTFESRLNHGSTFVLSVPKNQIATDAAQDSLPKQ